MKKIIKIQSRLYLSILYNETELKTIRSVVINNITIDTPTV